ncbi:MAG: cytochrome P460 family protein [Burkholderiales bacterium]|nr:cytochrome P460 family protein [Burkholderiales bacterium]MCW5622560.1 cytochrome P460 family protein [Burkholderiales bacterium]
MTTKRAAVAALLLAPAVALFAQDQADIAFPEGYRDWYQHHTTVNLQGHTPEGEVGIQNVYVNPAARAGLRSGKFEDGAMFVVDRFSYRNEDADTLKQDTRKVVAVMVRNAERYKATGGWGFQAFKGGNPDQPVVKDQGAACFTCHIPHAANNYLFTRGE